MTPPTQCNPSKHTLSVLHHTDIRLFHPIRIILQPRVIINKSRPLLKTPADQHLILLIPRARALASLMSIESAEPFIPRQLEIVHTGLPDIVAPPIPLGFLVCLQVLHIPAVEVLETLEAGIVGVAELFDQWTGTGSVADLVWRADGAPHWLARVAAEVVVDVPVVVALWDKAAYNAALFLGGNVLLLGERIPAVQGVFDTHFDSTRSIDGGRLLGFAIRLKED